MLASHTLLCDGALLVRRVTLGNLSPMYTLRPRLRISRIKKNAEVELGMLYVRNSILNTMLGKTIQDRVPRYRYIFNVPQLCYDSIAVAVVQEFGKLPGVSYKMEKEAGAERHFAMVESLDGAAAFLLGHVARPGVANEWLPSDHGWPLLFP